MTQVLSSESTMQEEENFTKVVHRCTHSHTCTHKQRVTQDFANPL